MRVYVAGPMSGKPQLNFPAFDEVAAKIRSLGYVPINPADFDRVMWPEGVPDAEDYYARQLKIDLLLVETCDAIVMLPGWESSKGARLEHAWAQALKLRTINLGDL